MSHCRLLIFAFAIALASLSAQVARADGCYSCGAGSSPGCKDSCRYSGSDTFQARKECEKRGCKVHGPIACPADPAAKICLRPKAAAPITVAAIPWCPRDPQSAG